MSTTKLPVMTETDIERALRVGPSISTRDRNSILALVAQAEARRKEHLMAEEPKKDPVAELGELFERAAEAWPRMRKDTGILELHFASGGFFWKDPQGRPASVGRDYVLKHIDHCAMVLAAELGMTLEVTEHTDKTTAMLKPVGGPASSHGGTDSTRHLAILHMIRHCAQQFRAPEIVVTKLKTADEAYAEGVRHGADAAKRRFPVAVPLEDLRRLIQMANSQILGKTGALIVQEVQELVQRAEKEMG